MPLRRWRCQSRQGGQGSAAGSGEFQIARGGAALRAQQRLWGRETASNQSEALLHAALEALVAAIFVRMFFEMHGEALGMQETGSSSFTAATSLSPSRLRCTMQAARIQVVHLCC